jgi:hypothetical protein
LLLRFDGVFLLRFAARMLDALSLFQLPPRLTRAVCPGQPMVVDVAADRKPLASVVEDAYQAWLWVDARVAQLPVSARRQLGHRLLDAVLDALTGTAEAVYLPRGRERTSCLQYVSRRLLLVRLLLRGARDRRYLSIDQHEHAMVLIDGWGRQVGGWIRDELSKSTPR